MHLKFKMIGSARPIPIWLWFFAVFAVTSFVGLLMYLDLHEKGKLTGNTTVDISRFFSGKESHTSGNNKPDKQTASKKENSDEEKNTGFDFYSLLPKMEVLVPESELSLPPTKENGKDKDKDNQTQPQNTVHAQTQNPNIFNIKGTYFLQAGAFKDLQAADRMKAGLGLLGIESKIESVKLDSGVWHRVRIGPFADPQQMNKIRNLMKSNSISSIMVKVNS